MSTIVLEAETRTDMGKGASRRLRRIDGKLPGIIYGGDKSPQSVTFLHKTIIKALENESVYSSVLNVKLDGKTEKVILKDLQRHPYKPTILHMDLQRVSAKDILVKDVPLHFLNEEDAKGVKAGGVISHNLTLVEVRCEVQDLPEFIAVDLLNVELDQVVHLSEIILPKGVELSTLPEGDHDHPVVNIHERKVVEEEPEVAAEPEQADGEASDKSSESEEDKKD